MIKSFYQQGISKSEIGRMLGIDRKTVNRYVKSESLPEYKRRAKPSILESYKEYIKGRLSEYNLTSVKIYEEVKVQGFKGKYGIVNLFVRDIKKELKREAVIRFETLPGEQAQVDWGYCGEIYDIEKQRTIKLYCFVMILGYSRMRYVEFFEKQDLQSFLEGHNHAFEYFGGYPREILYDNLKSVVIKKMLRAEESEFNKKFMDFAGYYGFKPILCRPYKPNTKGKVEASVKYVKNNFFAGEKFNSISEVNKNIVCWLMKINNFIHATTKEKPSQRLLKEGLITIAGKKLYDTSITEYRRIYKDCHFSYAGNFYSVPYSYAGKEASIKQVGKQLIVRYRDIEIARHILEESRRGVYITNPQHLEGLKELRYRNKPVKLKKPKRREKSFNEIILKKRETVLNEIVSNRALGIYEEELL